MKKQTIKMGMASLRETALSKHAEYIYSCMNGNASFPTPPVTMTDFKDMITDYVNALTQTESRDRNSYLAKNIAKTNLENGIRSLFNYVKVTGGTDITVLTSSGFPLATEPAPVGNMPMPENFTVRTGSGSGEMNLRCKAISGADSYTYQYIISPSPEVNNWTSITGTKSRCTITGLTPGTQYKFRMCAVGAKGQGPWSDAVNMYVV